MKVVIMPDRTHNPFDEIYRVSRLRENLTSGSEGEGLETGLRSTLNGHAGGNPGHSQGYSYGLPRQSFTRQNEGFNTQKNLGYALQHKYARLNWQAAKNYYQCLQIGHLINQLMVLSTTFAPLLQGKITLRHLWRTMIAFLLYGRLRRSTLDALAQRRFQVRFT